MTWRLISELQFCRSRASIRGDLIPFSSILDVGLYRNRTQPLDDERIIGRSERQRRFRAAGVGSAFEQRPRCGEVAILVIRVPISSSLSVAAGLARLCLTAVEIAEPASGTAAACTATFR